MNAIAKIEEAASLMEVISRAASDPAVDVTKLEKLMAMAERLEARNAERDFNIAMQAAQEEMGPVRTDANNPQTRSKYATYPALDRALRPIYTKHGFSISYNTGDGAPADYLRVLAYVSHRNGHTREYKIDMPADGKGAKGGDVMTKTHAVGSGFTYGQRYLLKGIFNIIVSDFDDDGNAAGSGDKITDEQAERILELLTKDKADVQKFCAYMKVGSIIELPAKEYTRAIEVINTRSQKAKAKT